jgi:hypothetical protein
MLARESARMVLPRRAAPCYSRHSGLRWRGGSELGQYSSLRVANEEPRRLNDMAPRAARVKDNLQFRFRQWLQS